MSYDQTVSEHARSGILRLLSAQPAYAANDSVLTDALRALGFSLSRDRVRTELDWLAEQGLVVLEKMDHLGLVIAQSTLRGNDVASGAAIVTGVKRPSPK